MEVRKSIFFIIFFLACSFVIAQYGVPHQFMGTVTVNGQSAHDGWLVTAEIDGKQVSAGPITDGNYGSAPDIFYVQDPNQDRAGDTIVFFVGNNDNREQAAEFTFNNGYVTELDLAVEGDFCGEGICTSGEDCSTCPTDCGECEAAEVCGDGTCSQSEGCSSCPEDCGECDGGSSSSSSSSRRSGGGGGSPSGVIISQTSSTQEDAEEETEEPQEEPGCDPDWTCSDWLDCVGGVQKRVCSDANSCDTKEGKPLEQRPCNVTREQIMPLSETKPQTTVDEEPSRSGFSRITGAVLGNGLAMASITALVVLAILVAGAIYYRRM